ncbi:VanZ family protein [Gemmatimonas sp.]|uniref:VanZ family protein n=1 Tax=Gemmatimonas sp. TaxID=1962908 RepID=UPI003DA54830
MALIIAATLLPFGGMAAEQIPPAWCVRCGSLWLTDVISNVAMFVPFGVALELRRWTVWRVAVVSLLFTLGVEALQSVGLPPGRSPALAGCHEQYRWRRAGCAAGFAVAMAASGVACAAACAGAGVERGGLCGGGVEWVYAHAGYEARGDAYGERERYAECVWSCARARMV